MKQNRVSPADAFRIAQELVHRSRRRLVLAALLAFVLFWLPLGYCVVRVDATSPYQACDHTVTFPVRIHIGDGVDPAPWRDAITEWDRHYPGAFTEEVERADVEVVEAATTWVTLPCDGKSAIVHSGHDANLTYWASHELVHTLGVRDYVPAGTNLTGYINPGVCPGSYSGIASYCAPREDWFGPDDDVMMRSLGYRWRLRVAF